jgi:tRNA (guanine37-N1)-methyltransferase
MQQWDLSQAKAMRFDVLTLFPEMFSGYLSQSLLKLAIDRGLVDVQLHNIRDWARGRHRMVDDRPFGGGPGMVLKPEPVVECVESVQAGKPPPATGDDAEDTDDGTTHEQTLIDRSVNRAGLERGHLVMLTPQGRRLTQPIVEELARHNRLVLLCGRYEGFDDRVRQILRPDEISIGDYILGGGELAAMVVIDAVVRLVPDVLGHDQSPWDDSFSGKDRWLEGPQYTRPREYRGLTVPEVLLAGNHEQIARWRHDQSLMKTKERRADLLRPEHDRTSDKDERE